MLLVRVVDAQRRATLELLGGCDRGMMVCGFEEIDGQRFYQGWWITWE
jgi:hypothetical protein